MEKDRRDTIFTSFPTAPGPKEKTASTTPTEFLSALMVKATPGKYLGGLKEESEPEKVDRKLFSDREFLELTPEVQTGLTLLASLGSSRQGKSSAEVFRPSKPETKFDGSENSFHSWFYKWNLFFHFATEPRCNAHCRKGGRQLWDPLFMGKSVVLLVKGPFVGP
jgi:hypothetical protein